MYELSLILHFFLFLALQLWIDVGRSPGVSDLVFDYMSFEFFWSNNASLEFRCFHVARLARYCYIFIEIVKLFGL